MDVVEMEEGFLPEGWIGAKVGIRALEEEQPEVLGRNVPGKIRIPGLLSHLPLQWSDMSWRLRSWGGSLRTNGVWAQQRQTKLCVAASTRVLSMQEAELGAPATQ